MKSNMPNANRPTRSPLLLRNNMISARACLSSFSFSGGCYDNVISIVKSRVLCRTGAGFGELLEFGQQFVIGVRGQQRLEFFAVLANDGRAAGRHISDHLRKFEQSDGLSQPFHHIGSQGG